LYARYLASRQEFLLDRPPRVGGLEFLRTPGTGIGPQIQAFPHTSSIMQRLDVPASEISYGPDRNCLSHEVRNGNCSSGASGTPLRMLPATAVMVANSFSRGKSA